MITCKIIAWIDLIIFSKKIITLLNKNPYTSLIIYLETENDITPLKIINKSYHLIAVIIFVTFNS